MKKAGQWLLAITLMFTSLVGGFFLGRNFSPGEVRISAPKTEDTQIITTAEPEVTTTSAAIPTTPTPSTQATTPTVPGKVNINTATVEELQTLDGIGPVLAQSIVDYRTENGEFQNLSDLYNVSGIGEKRLEAIWDDITTGGSE